MTNYKDIKRIPIVAADVPNLDATKITTGTVNNARITLDAAEIPNLATSKITTGTMADARISAGSVTQHVSATDLTPVRQDVLLLGLKQAVQENSTKFNLPNSAITKFEADADYNSGGSTTVSRNTSEYISAAVITGTDNQLIMDGSAASVTQVDAGTNGTYLYGSNAWTMVDEDAHTDYYAQYQNTNGRRLQGTWAAMQTDSVGTCDNCTTYNRFGAHHYSGITQDVYYAVDVGTTHNQSFTINRYIFTREFTAGDIDLRINGSNDLTGSWTLLHQTDSPDGTSATADIDSGLFTNTTKYRYYQIWMGNFPSVFDIIVQKLRFYGTTYAAAVNATGTALGTTNVPTSPVTDVSGVMLMKNSAGTNTLGTDVKAYFTADNSNWTEATSYADAGTFSDTTKMIKLGKTTCTIGSDVRWKIVWANQSGSKEGHIYGMGLNY